MAARIRFCRDPGESLGYSIERLADGAFWAGSPANTFAAPSGASAPPVTALPASPGLPGRYEATIPTTITSGWPDGNYCVNVHFAATGAVVACLGLAMHGGDDAPTFPLPIGLSGLQFTGTFK